MSLFKFDWLYRIVRRHSKPIAEDSANKWKSRLSLVYMLLAWNAFGVICYTYFKGRGDWAQHHGLPETKGTPAQQWSKTLGIKDATVYRISGLNVNKYEIHNEDSDLKKKPIFGFQFETEEPAKTTDGEMLTE